MKISVTEKDIQEALPYPQSSPVALALKKLGFGNVYVCRTLAFIETTSFFLPMEVIEKEDLFNSVFNTNRAIAEGRITASPQTQIKPYDFEILELDPKAPSNINGEALAS